MPKEINPWAMYPRKTSTTSLPAALKMEVITKANELIETGLICAILVSGYNCTQT